jgi:hypothetical protein
MDASGLLGLLVVVVLFDTLAIGALLVVTLRRPSPIRLESWSGRDRGAGIRTAPVASPAGRPAPTARAEAVVLDGIADSPASAAAPDPLADAITAFLGRSDGVFRTGVPPADPAPATDASSPATSGPRPPTGEPATAHGSAPIVPEPLIAPMRPSRYVASGTPRAAQDPAPVDPPRAAAETGPAETAADASAPPADRTPAPPALPTSGATPRPATDGLATAGRPAPGPTALPRPATRLSATLIGLDRQPSIVDEAAQVAAAARLSPVIAGLLRERSRAGDLVRVDGPGRFSLDLPDTTIAGAGALAGRLIDSCEAWLAAELPPLRLDLSLADLTGREIGPVTATARPSGPERRRLSTLNA